MADKIKVKKKELRYEENWVEYEEEYYPWYVRFLRWLFTPEWERFKDDMHLYFDDEFYRWLNNSYLRSYKEEVLEEKLDELGYEVETINHLKARIIDEDDIPQLRAIDTDDGYRAMEVNITPKNEN